MNKGREEGKKPGHAEKAIQIAKAMKKKAYEVKEIADVSGLSVMQIKKL